MPLATGQSIYRPPSPAAEQQWRGYVGERQALAAALAACPDTVPGVIRDPPGYPDGYYPVCQATGVFYSSARAALEDAIQLALDQWLPEGL